MSEQTAGSGFSVKSLLNPTLDLEDAGSTGGKSEYEPSDFQSYSSGSRESNANTQSTSKPQSTAQLSGPGQPTPTTTRVGCMPSPGGSSLVKSSQSVSCSVPAIDDPRRKPNLGGRTASSTEPSYMREAPNTSLHSMGSQSSFDATGGFSSPKSTAATSHSELSMASPEAHIHPPPTTTPSLHTAQWNQDLSAHPQGMQPYPGAPPSENAEPLHHKNVRVGDTRARYFRVNDEHYYMALPGSEQRLSVTVDKTRASKKADEKRKKNAVASTRHREKKKKKLEENLQELKNLREEKKEWEQDRKELEEDRDFYRNIVKQTPSLSHFVRPLKALSQTSNTATTKNQGSPDERQSKRRRTNEVSGLSTPAYGAFVNPPTGVGSELPPKQNLQDTSTRWVMSQSAGYRPHQPWW